MTILCVTPNPAIDRTLIVPGFVAGRVWRAICVHAACGGKGVNVARTLTRLGKPACCAGPLGGHAGRVAAERAEAEGLVARWTPVAGETRTCVIVADGAGEATVVNEPGPVLSPEEWSRFSRDVKEAARDTQAVCISGSLPCRAPTRAMAELIAAAGNGGRRPVWVDSSGAALDDALMARPFGVKINGDEAAALLGREVRVESGALTAALDIAARGPVLVAITLGHAGAVMVGEAGSWHAATPPIAAVNPVGSGDSFLAGLVAGFTDGLGPKEALRLAIACGAANAQSEHAGIVEGEVVRELMNATEARAL
jgi:1-phosphofructokinase family hexose kinase